MIQKTKKINTQDKITKLISMILIVSIVTPATLFLRPNQANAQWYTFSISDFFTGLSSGSNATTATTNSAQLGLKVKDAAKEILKGIAMAAARRALQESTKGMVNWINSGFHGNPLYPENPQSLLQDVAKSKIRDIVDIFGYDQLKYPFGKEFALSAINTYKETLEDNAAYTLSKATTDPVLIRNYQNDFNTGGWNGFFVNTQYPQNNPVGFQLIATEELARRVQGTAESAAGKIKSLLQQGQGFLSPQTCQTNPNYNNGYNEFNAPRFDIAKWERDYINANPMPTYDATYGGGNIDQYEAEWQDKHDTALAEARQGWENPQGPNVCPKKSDGTTGLINTTPGSVVADQIKINLGSGVHQKELAAAMGNSLSAVFDALISHFLDKGLNSLASTINPPPSTEDSWNYEGLTLGSGEGGTNIAWDATPEVPIVLEEFKKMVADGIENTTKEIGIMDETLNYMGLIWPEARNLDMCIPGPDMGWQERLQSEVLRNTQKLQKLQSDDNAKKSEEANAALKELKFAVDFFKDWINNKMITELPSSILFIDAVDDVKTLPQQATELIDAKRLKTQALARLQAIKVALDTITAAPTGSAAERTIISLKKQYDGIKGNVSSFASLSEKQNDLDVAKDKLSTLKKFVPQCEAERKAKGWGTPGGATSSYSESTVTTTTTAPPINGLPINSEQAIFCSLPIIGGYTHETFKNETGVTHPVIPMVNAKKIMRYEITTIKSFLTSLPGNHTTAAYVNIQLSCKAIFNAKLLDYKGTLPGLTTVREITDDLPDDSGTGETGTCTYSGVDANGAVLAPDTDMTKEDCDLNGGSWTPDGEGN